MATMLSPGGYVRQGSKNGGQTARAVNVQVAVRCRPLNNREKSAGERSIIKCDVPRGEIHFAPPVGRKAPSGGSNGKKTFTYDHVFGPSASQQDVYEKVVEPIVDEVLQGYNCTVFAYGQTGTGKTHTMEGQRDESTVDMSEKRLPQNAGMIPRAVKQVFDHLRSITDDHSVRVSHLELYNEQLTDLLGPEEETGDLRMYEDAQKGTFVNGLDEIVVRSEEEIFEILDKSAIKRKTAETLMNKFSSRSHSVFSITIHIKESSPDGTDLLKVGKLNLVDLAGSENVGRSGAVKGRAREAGNINQSLLTLGRVITALVEHHPHIPYRDSKLTRLLQESLGGRNKTCVIATATVGSSSYEETASTLDYAYRAKSIKNRPTVNQMVSKHVLLKEYTNEITKLKRELDANRQKNGVYLPADEFAKLQARAKTQGESIANLEEQQEEYKRATTELREKLDKTQDALYRSKRDIQKKVEELSITQGKLDDETEAKEIALRERDEERYIVSKYAQTENELHSQIVTLQGTIEKSVNDIDLLHDRVDEKNRLEKENIRTASELRDAVSEGARSLRGALRAYETNHDAQLRATQAKVGDIVADVGSGFSHISSHLKSLRTHMEALQEVHIAEASKFEDGVVESCAEFSEVSNASIQAQVARLSAVKEDVSSACVSVNEVLSKILQDTEALNASFKAFDTKQTGLVRDMVNSTKTGLDTLSTDVAFCMTAHEAELSSLQTRLQESFQRQTKQGEKAKEDAMAKFKQLLDTMMEENKNANLAELELAKGAIAKSKQESQKKSAAVTASCGAIAASVDSFQGALREEGGKIEGAVSGTSAETTECASLCRRIVDGEARRVSDLIGSATQHELKLQAGVSAHCAGTSDSVQGRTVRRLEEESAKREMLQEGEENIGGRVTATGAQVSALAQFVAERTAAQRQLVADACIGTGHALDAEVAAPVKAFEVAVDAGNADAPERREWKFPTAVTLTKSRSALLAELRADAAVAAAEPASPALSASVDESSAAGEHPSEEEIASVSSKENTDAEKSETASVSSAASLASQKGAVVEDSTENSSEGSRRVLGDDTNVSAPSSSNVSVRPRRTGKTTGLRRPRVLSTRRNLG